MTMNSPSDSDNSADLKGRYFAQASSASHEAVLTRADEKLFVINKATGETTEVQFEALGERLGNVPRKVIFKDDSVFECADNDAVDRFFKQERSFFSKLSGFEASSKFVAIAVVATIALVFGMYRYGLPVVAQFAAWATPTAAVQLIDRGALDTVDRAIFKPSNMSQSDKDTYTNLFDELVGASDLGSENVRLLFRDGGRMGANAVALPGGTIILTDQLAKLSENEDEVAGVLAHELGHVSGRHSLRQIYRAVGIAFMISVIVGDTSQLLDNVVTQVALLDTLSFSRHFETESDATSVAIMQKLGRDPVAFIDLIDRVFKSAGVDGDDTGWFSTHPGNENRRKDVEALTGQ